MNSATFHFIAQRASAIILVPLGLWFLANLTHLEVTDLTVMVAWFQKPRVMLFMLLFIGSLFYHAFLGIQVVIEDYVSEHEQAIRAMRWLFLGAAGICAVFVLTLFAFGASS